MNNKYIMKSMLIWLSITPLAILNGMIREYLLLPLLGVAALPTSGLLLMLCIFAVTTVFLPRLGSAKISVFIKIGFIWVIATILFEFTIGIAMGTPVNELLQAYNVLTGNLWSVIVGFIGLVPIIVAKIRHLY